MRIGTLEIGPYLLAPLEGVSDCAFRALCHRLGASFTWTEMVRASGVIRENRATLDLIDTHDTGTPTGLQLFATNERELLEALRTIDRLAATSLPHLRNIRAVDLNFGCPSPEIIRIGAGPALLKRQAKMETMLRTLREWREMTELPIGAIGLKVRLGLNEQEKAYKIYLRVIAAANAHADYIVVHARHARQLSTDPADWDAIKEIVQHATIPVIGNGDALTAADCLRMREHTGCPGVMLARGAIRNPWVFRGLAGGQEMPTGEEIAAAAQTYSDDAARWHAKGKYITFHRENFARMRDGKTAVVPTSPHLR